jgi:lipoprotein-releasing system ATP-binding protein
MTPILKGTNLKKSFTYPSQVSVLDGVNLTVYPNESIAIMGRSGEGKSTLLHILGTLETPTSGTLEIAGKNGYSHPQKIRNQHIGFIFQGFHLLEDETAFSNVLMPAKIGRKSKSFQTRALDLLDRVGLKDRAHFNVQQLSGGEKQRVAIARALCNHPDLILADEPTGNLDSQTANEIHRLLFSFVRQEGKSLIVVTHDPNLAALCDRRLILSDGLLSDKLQYTEVNSKVGNLTRRATRI